VTTGLDEYVVAGGMGKLCAPYSLQRFWLPQCSRK